MEENKLCMLKFMELEGKKEKTFEYYNLGNSSYINRVAFNKCVSTSRKRKGMAGLLSRFRVSDKRENGLIKYDESKKYSESNN